MIQQQMQANMGMLGMGYQQPTGFGGFMQQPMFMQPTYDPGVSAAQAAVAAALRAAQNLRG